jgi:hypothetical protein
MKIILALCIVMSAFAGCRKSTETPTHAGPPTATFKNGHGVNIPEPMRKSLGIEVADVAEQKITPRVRLSLHAMGSVNGKNSMAEGWLTEAQAKSMRPGMAASIVLADGKTAPGTVRQLQRSPYSTTGDFEILLDVDASLEPGTPMTAILDMPATGEW